MSETTTPTAEPDAPAKPTFQLINVVHHSRALFDSEFFGQGEQIFLVEKIRFPDGRVVKRLNRQADPKIKFYLTAPEFQAEQTRLELFYPIEKTLEYEIPVGELQRGIATLTDQMAFWNDTRGPGARRLRRKLHAHRHLHGSDVNLADHYIDKFFERMGTAGVLNTVSPLDKAFADIEVDGVNHVGFPEESQAPCPINLINYFYEPTKTYHAFILRNSVLPNPQIAEFESKASYYRLRVLAEANRAPLEKETKKKGVVIPRAVPIDTPWEEIIAKTGLDGSTGQVDPVCVSRIRCRDVKLHFFDTEAEVIFAFLNQVNEVDRPDTIGWWNMKFDVVTMINRLGKLGFDPQAAFTPKDFGKWAQARYNDDQRATDPAERGDTFDCTSYTIWVDMMLLYAQLRKTSAKKDSYAYEAIISEEIGERKRDLGGSIKDAAYRDFASFIVYGAGDVVPLATLDAHTEDIEMAYQIGCTTRTRFHKVMKKTVCLANLARVFLREQGLVLSNNHNALRDRVDRPKFRGA